MSDRFAWLGTQLENVDDVPKRELPTDAEWRKTVIARMDELKLSQGELGKWIDCAQSHVHYLLHPERALGRSQYVERISKAFRIPLPRVARIELAVLFLSDHGDDAGLEHLATSAEFAVSKTQTSNLDKAAPTIQAMPTPRRRTKRTPS